MKRVFLFFLLFFILSIRFSFAFNPRSITYLYAEIVESGRVFSSGNIKKVEISLHIPERFERIEVSPKNWELDEDELGNKIIRISWINPNEVETYKIKIRVKNYATFFDRIGEEDWRFLEEAKKETFLTEANDEMRKFAFGNETNLEKAARLTEWIHRNVEYVVLEEGNKPAQVVWKERKGVCSDFANLLIALLRSQKIPARYVVGYAIPSLNASQDFLSHAWVEVFHEGKWIPFDPTWFEGGYLDATHIKLGYLLDGNFSETIYYEGFGMVSWERDPPQVRLIEYKEEKPFSLTLNVEDMRWNSVSLMEVVVEGCGLNEINLHPCVFPNGTPTLKVFDPKRRGWFCGREKIYFLTASPRGSKNLISICPIKVSDQNGFLERKVIEISGEGKHEEISLEGLSTIKFGDEIRLKSPIQGIFFSPNFTYYSSGNFFSFKPKILGSFLIYFFGENSFGKALIKVIEEKNFEILGVEKPEVVFEGENFSINVSVKNYGKESVVPITLEFLDQSFRQEVFLKKNEEKNITFELEAKKRGKHKFLIVLEDKVASYYSGYVEIVKKETKLESLIEKILSFFEFIFKLLELKF